jgi:hypothetical protein
MVAAQRLGGGELPPHATSPIASAVAGRSTVKPRSLRGVRMAIFKAM